MLWIIILMATIEFSNTLTTATLQSRNTTACVNLNCSDNAKCKDDGNGGKGCQCHAGYTGPTCHDDFDECSIGNPCWHRGICRNTIGSYRCACLEGWLEEHCVAKDNSTDVHKCEPGYMGEWCQDKCLNDSMCRQTEVCQMRGRGLRCLCAPGWRGINCTTDIDECTNIPCSNTSICINTLGSYECQCLPGWKGDACGEDDDECQMSPCLNFGTCINSDGSYTCNCSQGWQGVNCAEDVDECQKTPCFNTGTCRNKDGTYICTCVQGWQGENCQFTDSCYYSPCENAATCFNVQDTYQCSCATGWKGKNCTDDVDECARNTTCLNNGTCVNTLGSYACNCNRGWQGDVCDSDVNECLSDPCNSSFTCINNIGSFSCDPDIKGSWGRASSGVAVIVGSVLGSVVALGGITTGVMLTKYKILNRNSVSGGNDTAVQVQKAAENEFAETDVSSDKSEGRIRDYLIRTHDSFKNFFVKK